MEISEGMYIRTNNGYISKIICFKSEPISNNEIILIKGKYKGNKDKEYGYVRDYYGKGTSFLYRGEIIKASYSIIDLFEEGDLIRFGKDGYWLTVITIFEFGKETHIKLSNGYLAENVKEDDEWKNIDIVTKEQMESMAYEVEK